MKPHITNLQHQQFIVLMEDAIKKTKVIPSEEKTEISVKIAELEKNKNELEEIYASYKFKLKELRSLLDEYERVQHTSRIELRKMQLWIRFIYAKVMKAFS